jgi:hypothetical protein
MRVDLPWNFRKGPSYLLQLPPEYHHARSYPVLFVLHAPGEKPEVMLKRWSAMAAQYGYILVSPEWERSLNSAYEFSDEEHASVVDVLRDLRRYLQVDSDRVFLFGAGESGTMAFDVGLSHPDLFAGVLVMASRPRYFAKSYWRNGQFLPFYVVNGDMAGDDIKDIRRQFEHWVTRGYPSLYVEYKGRGQDWFWGELPNFFDWMSHKKRATALPFCGKPGGGTYGEEFQSMRATDNRFYWIVGEEIHNRHINDGQKWSSRTGAATLQAHISEGNQINVNAHGFKRVTVWLGPGTIDLDKPVKIYVNGRLAVPSRKITPSLRTLLEDYYQRGDRHRLFWAKVELPL